MDGYAKVARVMAEHPELAIFREFRALNIQNLLYQQAEIIHLEDGLRSIVNADAEHPERQQYSRDWWSLSQSEDEDDKEQWKAWREIQCKLEKYNKNLVQLARVIRIGSPRRYDLDFLRSWFDRPSLGGTPLMGLDRSAWDSDYDRDLVGVKTREAPDRFSKWFTEKVVPAYHHFLGKRHKQEENDPQIGDGIFLYRESALDSFISILTTVVASILPILSVVILYNVADPALKLGLLVVFSACFALALATMTSGRKIEVFAATAAFAAVNVVFLTSNTNSV